MKRLLFFVLQWFSLLPFNYAQQNQWARSDTVNKLAVDSAGNIYTAGNYKISRYNTAGTILWQKQLGGNFIFVDLVADQPGDLFFTCYYSSFTMDADSFPCNGGTDIFFGKIDTTGSLIWYKIYGAPGNEVVSDIFIDKKQDIFICGSVGGGTVVENDTFLQPAYFAARYNSNGISTLIVRGAGDIYDNPREIATDSSGNIFLFGALAEDTLDFGNGVSVSCLSEYSDNYIVKINNQGIAQWSKILGTTYKSGKSNLGVASNGSFYLIMQGYYEGFALLKYDTLGNNEWCNWMYAVYGTGHSLQLDKDENIWVAGYLSDGGDFYPYPYVWKYHSSGVLLDTIMETYDTHAYDIACDKNNYIYINGIFAGSQSFGDTSLYAAHGWYLAKMIGSYPTASFTSQEPYCEQQDVLFTNSSFNATDIHWVFPGGQPANSNSDSSVNVHYSLPGDYTIILIANNDGFSDTMINAITVNHLPDVTLSLAGVTLTATQTQANYQWLNCEGGLSEIPGATEQSYPAITNGDYAVIIDLDGCVDTSECVVVNTVGKTELSNGVGGEIIIFPNPSQGTFIIKSFPNISAIILTNLLGENIYSSQSDIQISAFEINLPLHAPGIYFLQVFSGGKSEMKKIVIE